MTEFLVKHFIKRYEHVEEMSVRTAYGMLSSIVGIFCNVLLFIVKVIIGIMLSSVSVMADAFNNFSDAGSSIIGLIGIRIAGMPADEKHPFGHGRIEYLTALIVAFLVIQVGLTFLKDSIDKIIHPQELQFQFVSIVILFLSIGVKLWLGQFNRTLGSKIDSKVMLATAADSMGDVFTTFVTVLSIIIWRLVGINIDGIVGILVSGIVMWSGIEIAKDTLEPLIGEAVTPEVYKKITEFVEGYDGIEGSHDLIVHNYGPNKSMASIHAEVSNQSNIEESHAVIDQIERDCLKKLGIFLVIHMDPIETKNEHVLYLKQVVKETLMEIDPQASIHDFRVIALKDEIHFVFDMIVPYSYSLEQQKQLYGKLETELEKIDKRYKCVINIEKGYGGITE